MSERKIPMVDLKTQFKKIEGEVMEEISKVLNSSAYINGPWVKSFASELAEYTGSQHVIPCGNGTDALQIALMALQLQPGDEVIVPSFTYVATVEVISLLGLIPVYVEVDGRNFNINPSEVSKKITPQTKAIIAVHLFGQSAPMEELLQICKDHDLYLIEDNAQALGAQYTFSDGTVKSTGTMGDIGTTSFFPSKNLGTYGDGGALFVQNDEWAHQIRMVANHGQRIKYHHDIIGVNSRLDTLHAAILRVKLRYLDEYAESRNHVAETYDEHLSAMDGIELPSRSPNSTHVFHQYTLKVKTGNRNELKDFLASKGIPSMIYYPVPQHLQKAYDRYGYREGDFPLTEQLCREVLSLPIHTEMNPDDQSYIIQEVKNFFARK